MIKSAFLASLFSAASLFLAPAYASLGLKEFAPGYDEDALFMGHPKVESEFQTKSLEKCGLSDYVMSLHISGHVMLVGFPLGETADCPVVAFHDRIGATPGKVHQKEMIMVPSTDAIVQALEKASLLTVGTFKLSVVVKAFEEADAGEEDEYDSIENSCIAVIVSMATSLGLKADHQTISYITTSSQQRSLRVTGLP
jgi:hypothetical protein